MAFDRRLPSARQPLQRGSGYFATCSPTVPAYTEGRPRTLDEVRETVLDDWRRDHVAARESERYAEMRARYEVDVAPFASIGDLVQP